MASGIWPAVSGAKAQERAIEAVANNLANQNTPAFKKDTPAFKEYLAALEREAGPLDVSRGPIKDKEFYPLDGRDQSFVVNDGTYTDFKQGHLRVTEHPLDVALDGKGLFEISTPSGIRYTRQGSFKMSKDGQLVTSEGYPVLSAQPGGLAARLPATAVQPNQGGLSTQGGVGAEPDASVVSRYINLGDTDGRFRITEAGDIYSGQDLISKLSIVEFVDPQQLNKVGGSLFENPRGGANIKVSPNNTLSETIVRQGVIENSNVNPIEEMTRLIQAHRLFENNIKAIQTHDRLMEREVNEVGKL